LPGVFGEQLGKFMSVEPNPVAGRTAIHGHLFDFEDCQRFGLTFWAFHDRIPEFPLARDCRERNGIA
jgi:hypothetical protein